MSRLDELKKQYPELNITIFDMMIRMDNSKTYKYLPLLCKIIAERFNLKKHSNDVPVIERQIEVQSRLQTIGINTKGLNGNQLFFYYNLTDFFNHDIFSTFNQFIDYMEKGRITNKDVTSYGSLDDMRGAITLASIKEISKELENQVIKEFEDETWVVVRPLTFSSSLKYGASTRWCTTYVKEKNYFEKYWRQGILVYFINKKTGYKFAGFKDLSTKEISFWNAEDSRVDYLEIAADDYLFPIVRKIFSSSDTNKNLCTSEVQEQVHNECIEEFKIRSLEFDLTEPILLEGEVPAPRA